MINIFSIYHILLVLITFLIVLLIIKYHKYFVGLSSSQKKKVRYLLAALLIANFALRRGSFLYYGVFDWKSHLDIGFCNITWAMFLIFSLTGSKKIYNICYYMTFIGPVSAILLPSVNLSPSNYSFFSFIIIHHLILIFNFVFYLSEGQEEFGIKGFIPFITLYLIIINVFNIIFKTDYNAPVSFVNSLILNNTFIHHLAQLEVFPYIMEFVVVIIGTLAGFVCDRVLKKHCYITNCSDSVEKVGRL